MAVLICPTALLTAAIYLPLARWVGDPGDDRVAVTVTAVTVVLAHSLVAFAFNTVILGLLVAALAD